IPDLARELSQVFTSALEWSPLERLLLLYIGACIALQVAFALTPLMFYDLQVYHFLAPAQFLMSGRLNHIPWNMLTNTPLAMQLTVGSSLSLDDSGQTAKLLFALISFLATVGAYEFIRPSGRRAALVAAACVLSFPEFLMAQTLGAIDVAMAGLMIFG